MIQTSSGVKLGRAGLVLGWVTIFKKKPLCKSFSSHYHSFSRVLKHRRAFLKCYIILDTRLHWVNVESVLGQLEGRRLSFLACNLLWPLIETSDRVKWDSPIAKSFMSVTEAERSREDGETRRDIGTTETTRSKSHFARINICTQKKECKLNNLDRLFQLQSFLKTRL